LAGPHPGRAAIVQNLVGLPVAELFPQRLLPLIGELSLQAQGLVYTDHLARRLDAAGQADRMLHQQKQLGMILDTTLGQLDDAARTALDAAAWLPPDTVAWPWLRELTLELHPHLSQFEPDEPDPWLEVRRRLEGLRLLIGGDQPQLARIHRLVSAHLQKRMASGADGGQTMSRTVTELLVRQAWSCSFARIKLCTAISLSTAACVANAV
jgi:hypothetical protein